MGWPNGPWSRNAGCNWCAGRACDGRSTAGHRTSSSRFVLCECLLRDRCREDLRPRCSPKDHSFRKGNFSGTIIAVTDEHNALVLYRNLATAITALTKNRTAAGPEDAALTACLSCRGVVGTAPPSFDGAVAASSLANDCTCTAGAAFEQVTPARCGSHP